MLSRRPSRNNGTACANNVCTIALANGVAAPTLSIDNLLEPDLARAYSIYGLTATADALHKAALTATA